jgi:hypothetical protein
MIARVEAPPTPDETPEPTEHSDEGHLPSVSSCSSGAAASEAPVRCTFALTHPERPCPATAIESLLLMQENGIPAIVSLRPDLGLGVLVSPGLGLAQHSPARSSRSSMLIAGHLAHDSRSYGCRARPRRPRAAHTFPHACDFASQDDKHQKLGAGHPFQQKLVPSRQAQA